MNAVVTKWAFYDPTVKKRLFRWTTYSLIVFVVTMVVGLRFGQYYTIGKNATESLPQSYFLVIKGEMPVLGDYVKFLMPDTRYYRKDMPAVKVIRGVAGDVVTVDADRNFYINGEFIVKSKEWSLAGHRLDVGPTGVIPEGHYFVATPHVDGYDSRYNDIGWIPEERIVGRATPEFNLKEIVARMIHDL